MSKHWLVHGDARATRAVVLGPVSPEFDNGDFCAVLTNFLLGRGYCVVVVDTPALLEGAATEPDLLERLVTNLQEPAGGARLLAGYALGGTLAVKLAHRLPDVDRVLSISGPGFVTDSLRSGLVPLMNALEAGHLHQALEQLAEAVAPIGQRPDLRHRDALQGATGPIELAACRRMLAGFRLLFELDVRPEAASYPGALMCLVGELSRLATADNQAISAGPRRLLATVPGAGMRVLRDNPEFSVRAIEGWLNR